MDEISKKELLAETGISYGQLYRWKRERLIPEEWFIKRSSFTGQETFFPRERILERVRAILEQKDTRSLVEIRLELEGKSLMEADGLLVEAIETARTCGSEARMALFETNDGKHYLIFTQDGRVLADGGVKPLFILTEKEVRARLKGADAHTGGTQNAI